MYALGGLRAVFGPDPAVFRWFINLLWVLTALPVYAIARHAHSHRAGLAGLAIFLFFPFPIAFGMWLNTQAAGALLSLTAVYLYLRSDPTDLWSHVGIGVVLGLAFLVRRSSITVVFAIVLYLAWRALRERRPGWRAVLQYDALLVGFVAALSLVYGALAYPSVADFAGLWDTHFMGLFSSNGRGGFALAGADAEVARSVGTGRIPIFNDLCQLCGAHTAKVMAQTLFLILPAIAPLLVYVRAGNEALRDGAATDLTPYLSGIVYVLFGYGAAQVVNSGHHFRLLALVGAAGFAYVAWRLPVVDRDVLYSKELQLVLLAFVGLCAGYLYRNRAIHVYYFMDMYPFVAILSGVVAAEVTPHLRSRMDVSLRPSARRLRRVALVALVFSLVVSAGGAYPATNIILHDNDDGWFTVENINEYGADIDARTEPGDRVLAGMPTYVAESDRKMAMDRPRLHYVAASFGPKGPGQRQADQLTHSLETGRIQLVILTDMTETMFVGFPNTTDAFEDNYCRVADPETQRLYNRTDATLYEYNGDTDESCPPPRRPPVAEFNTSTSDVPEGLE